MKRSELVIELAKMASTGKYTVSPAEAKRMNELFGRIAALINELEAEEAEKETPDVG